MSHDLRSIVSLSSIIAIVDGTKQVYDAASSTKGLPEAFREVAARLPIVEAILSSAKQHVEKGGVNESSCQGAKDVVEACKKKAQKLEKLFQRVIAADGASKAERYLSAVKTLGKGSQVETFMKGMLEDVKLLAINHGMIPKTESQNEELAKAIADLAALPPSLPPQAPQKAGFTATHSGSGTINQVHGDQYSNPGSGQFYHAEYMHSGSK